MANVDLSFLSTGPPYQGTDRSKGPRQQLGRGSRFLAASRTLQDQVVKGPSGSEWGPLNSKGGQVTGILHPGVYIIYIVIYFLMHSSRCSSLEIHPEGFNTL